MNWIFFQCSLILEYCSKGDLRSYLINHEKEFNKSLEFYQMNKCLATVEKDVSDTKSHNVALLCQWVYQVTYIFEHNQILH